MRLLLRVLGGLLIGAGLQVGVLYLAVHLAKSPAFDGFPAVGTGSVGALVLLEALELLLGGVLALILWRRRRSVAVFLLALPAGALILTLLWL